MRRYQSPDHHSIEFKLRNEKAEEYYERFERGEEESELAWLMARHVESLRENNIPVDVFSKMRPEAFNGVIEKREITRDVAKARRLQRKYERQGRAPQAVSKLLETLKTVHITQWCSDFIAVRASDFDDIVNGVDELIVDRKTGEPFAAVDVTIVTKGEHEKMSKEEVGARRRDGATVKYGLALNEGEIPTPRSLQGLPFFVAAVEVERVMEWTRRVEEKMTPAERQEFTNAIRDGLFNAFLEQSIEMEQMAATPGLQQSYGRLARRFRKIGEAA